MRSEPERVITMVSTAVSSRSRTPPFIEAKRPSTFSRRMTKSMSPAP